MVRFARAEGSKGSNKKQFEEPTPWTDMVAQLGGNKKKRKKNQEEVESVKKDSIPGQATKKFKKTIATSEQQEANPQNVSQAVKNQKTVEEEESHPVQTTQNTVKKNKEKKKGAKTSQPEYTITPEGKRVKVFRDGTERTWFDLPYEESDAMTRYEGMWVKKPMVGELDRLKATLQEEGLDKKGIMKKMMKAKRKAHRELRIELIYQQKSLVNEAIGKEQKGDSVAVKVKKKNNDSTKKKKQKPFTMGNGSWSSPNKENRMQANPKQHSLLGEGSKEEVVNTEEAQEGDDNDGHQEDDTELTVTSQAFGKERKKRKANGTVGKIKKENTVETNTRKEVTPSQADESDNEGRDNENSILTPQDDYKVKKKKKSKKGKPEEEIVTSESNMKEDDKDVTRIPQTGGKTKEKKEKEDELETEMRELPTEIEYNSAVGEVKSTETNKEIYEHNLNERNHTSSSQEGCKNKVNGAENIHTYANKAQESNDCDFKKREYSSSSQEGFEENEVMTNYDGYWVLREEVEILESAKEMELKTIYAARTDGSDSGKRELSREEQFVFQRAMKKRKRFHHRKLLQKLSKTGKKVGAGGKGKKGDKKEDDSEKVAKFDGFWVKKEAADRLYKLRKSLYKEGLSQQEVDALIQKERRKEERVLKNERKLVCLNCRQPGHMVSACPNIVQAQGEGQPSICYTCGSTEHTSSTCNLKKGSEKSFSFATCYICGETGHISRQCPDNPRGLYPKGGACRGCGSVEHLAKDCPDLQKEKEESNMRVGRLKGEELEALDEDADEATDQDVSPALSRRDRPKVVKF